MNVEDFVDDCYKREAYLRAYIGSILYTPLPPPPPPPYVGERHWPRMEQQLDPPSIKIRPSRPRKNRRKDPRENPKRPGRLTKHDIEMRYSVCKSKATHKKDVSK